MGALRPLTKERWLIASGGSNLEEKKVSEVSGSQKKVGEASEELAEHMPKLPDLGLEADSAPQRPGHGDEGFSQIQK